MDPSRLTTLIPFLLKAKQATYAASEDPVLLARAQRPASRPNSHDLGYSEGDLDYYDTYLGGYAFAGEEAVWQGGAPVWSMNYYGTMTVPEIPEGFGPFLKFALRQPPAEAPYRGPECVEQGRYTYECAWKGDFTFFHGEETIALDGQVIYILLFHGGAVV